MVKKLTKLEEQDLKRLRIKKEFDDGNAKGTILIDEVSSKTFLEFRDITRSYFGNKDGPSFAGLVQLFLAEKSRQKVMKEKEAA